MHGIIHGQTGCHDTTRAVDIKIHWFVRVFGTGSGRDGVGAGAPDYRLFVVV